MEGDHINCWVRGREFIILKESIQELLEIRPTTPDTSLHYNERKKKLEPFVKVLRGQLKKKALHTIEFSLEMRDFAYIMNFNLYLVKNLTTLSTPRTVFLHDLFTHKEIDICGHMYHLLIKCIEKRNSRLTLPFPCLVMSLISRARVKIPSGLSVRKSLSRAKLTFPVQAPIHLKFQEMKLQKKEATPMRKLSDLLLYQRILHGLLLKLKLKHPTTLIIYFEG